MYGFVFFSLAEMQSFPNFGEAVGKAKPLPRLLAAHFSRSEAHIFVIALPIGYLRFLFFDDFVLLIRLNAAACSLNCSTNGSRTDRSSGKPGVA